MFSRLGPVCGLGLLSGDCLSETGTTPVPEVVGPVELNLCKAARAAASRGWWELVEFDTSPGLVLLDVPRSIDGFARVDDNPACD